MEKKNGLFYNVTRHSLCEKKFIGLLHPKQLFDVKRIHKTYKYLIEFPHFLTKFPLKCPHTHTHTPKPEQTNSIPLREKKKKMFQ